jgi:uncharacterized protein
MKFDWDEAKNFENIRKHEIDFADVPAIFSAIADLVRCVNEM